MATPNPYEKYQNLAINTLTPGELIILLYDEISLSLNKAMYNIKNSKTNDAHNNIIKAENIVLYLIDILDMNYPIADKLLELYDFIYKQLVKANVEKNPKLIEETLKLADSLKETWKQADIITRKKSKL